MAAVVQAAPPLVLRQQYSAVLGADGRPRQLGSGGYGAVWLFKDINTQEKVAIKRMQLLGLPHAVAAELNRVLPRELRIHYRLHHPHIASMKDVFLSTDSSITYINIVLEYVEGGTLINYVNGVFTADGCITEDLARWLFQQMVITLEYLHAQDPPVSHRDIKLENALAQPLPPASGMPGPIVKVVDFGLSTTGHIAGTLDIGTAEYKAPELFSNPAANNNPYAASPVDIWATGVMLYAVLNMRYPWPNTMTQQQRWQAMHARPLQYNRPAEHALSADCTDLLDRMLKPDPAKRITIQGIMQHPWFRQGLNGNNDGALLMNAAALQLPSPCVLAPLQLDVLVHQVQQILQPQLPAGMQQQQQQQQPQAVPLEPLDQ